MALRGDRVDWDQAVALARRVGCERHLALGAVLAEALLAAPLPPALTREVSLLTRAAAAAWPLPTILAMPPVTDREAIYRLGLLRSLRWSMGSIAAPRAAGRCWR